MRTILILLIFCLLCNQQTHATTFTVINTNNSGPGSLYQAIIDANADTIFPTIINFNIPGSGIHTIKPVVYYSVGLPRARVYAPITRTMTIDATTQPGYTPSNPQIEIDCVVVAATPGVSSASCLAIQGTDNCVIKGLIIDQLVGGVSGRGISIENTVTHGAQGNKVTQCFIGAFSLIDPFGNTRGIVLDGRNSINFPVNGTIIGGPNFQDANVLSGNSVAGLQAQFNVHNSVIQNNIIGCDKTGSTTFSNQPQGINIIGDITVGACNNNVISDNVIASSTTGIVLQSSANNTIIQNNKIGTDISGTVPLGIPPAPVVGIVIQGDAVNTCVNNLVGGSNPGQGNLISHNSGQGIYLSDQANNNIIQGNFIGTDISGALPIPNDIGIEFQGGITTGQLYSIRIDDNDFDNRVRQTPEESTIGKTSTIKRVKDVRTPGSPCIGNLIGGTTNDAKNIINFNTSNGILLTGDPTTPDILNAILGNNIYLNGANGISLTNNGNDLQEGPTIEVAGICANNQQLFVSGKAPDLPITSNFRIEFFVNSANHNPITEGERFIGAIPSITSGANFAQFFPMPVVPVMLGSWLSATATNLNNGGNPGDTSEFTLNTQIQIISCPTPCFAPNKLILANTYSHGAPIQSVAWSCPTEDCPYALAAIGGYRGCSSSCNCASIRAYTLDTSTNKLTEILIDNPVPTDYVYAVNWCCAAGSDYSDIFLGVAGCPDAQGNSFWSYNYHPMTNSLQPFGNPFAYHGTIYTTKCVSVLCNGRPHTIVLIAGQQVDGTNISALSYDFSTQQFVSVGQALFGDTIFAMDACQDSRGCPIIAVGGKPAYGCAGVSNIGFYTVDCEGTLIQIGSAYFKGGTVRSIAWCCPDTSTCNRTAYLAVGGDAEQGTGTDVQLFAYNLRTGAIKSFAEFAQQDKVFAIDWLQGCDCSYLAVGSGCITETCVPNLELYRVDRCLLPKPEVVSKKHFDDNISSLAACKIGDVTYVLAGSERNNWAPVNSLDPLCPLTHWDNELALYMGIFCKKSAQPCAPETAWQRLCDFQA